MNLGDLAQYNKTFLTVNSKGKLKLFRPNRELLQKCNYNATIGPWANFEAAHASLQFWFRACHISTHGLHSPVACDNL